MLRFRSDTRGDKKSLHKNSLIYRGLKQLILKANGYKDDFIEFYIHKKFDIEYDSYHHLPLE